MSTERSTPDNWIIADNFNNQHLPSRPNNFYIGIDFGTSTTVVSQVLINENNTAVKVIPLGQPDEFGATIRHHLINTDMC